MVLLISPTLSGVKLCSIYLSQRTAQCWMCIIKRLLNVMWHFTAHTHKKEKRGSSFAVDNSNLCFFNEWLYKVRTQDPSFKICLLWSLLKYAVDMSIDWLEIPFYVCPHPTRPFLVSLESIHGPVLQIHICPAITVIQSYLWISSECILQCGVWSNTQTHRLLVWAS